MARRTTGGANFAQIFGLAGLIALTTARARAEDYSACAKIANAFAYNACLARHGPPAHGTCAIAPPAGGDGPRAVWRGRADPRRAGAAIQFSRGRHGRMTAVFSIDDAPARGRRGHTP